MIFSKNNVFGNFLQTFGQKLLQKYEKKFDEFCEYFELGAVRNCVTLLDLGKR